MSSSVTTANGHTTKKIHGATPQFISHDLGFIKLCSGAVKPLVETIFWAITYTERTYWNISFQVQIKHSPTNAISNSQIVEAIFIVLYISCFKKKLKGTNDEQEKPPNQNTHLFCSSSLASSSTSSGLRCAGEDGERAGEERDVEEEVVVVVCRDVGVATWLAIWLTVCDTEFFTHERVELSLPATLSVATCQRIENTF